MTDYYDDLLYALGAADRRVHDLNNALEQYIRDLEGRLRAQEARIAALQTWRDAEEAPD